jgi:hypothetical protein
MSADGRLQSFTESWNAEFNYGQNYSSIQIYNCELKKLYTCHFSLNL